MTKQATSEEVAVGLVVGLLVVAAVVWLLMAGGLHVSSDGRPGRVVATGKPRVGASSPSGLKVRFEVRVISNQVQSVSGPIQWRVSRATYYEDLNPKKHLVDVHTLAWKSQEYDVQPGLLLGLDLVIKGDFEEKDCVIYFRNPAGVWRVLKSAPYPVRKCHIDTKAPPE